MLRVCAAHDTRQNFISGYRRQLGDLCILFLGLIMAILFARSETEFSFFFPGTTCFAQMNLIFRQTFLMLQAFFIWMSFYRAYEVK